jgi:hypothetical protein
MNSQEIENPRLSIGSLDTYYIKKSILSALRLQIDSFNGTILDVGCGYMPYKPLLMGSSTKVEKYLGLDLEK